MTRRNLAPVLIGLMLVFTAVVISRLPAELPIHWGVDGTPDSWGPRWLGGLVLPSVSLGIWLLLRIMPRIDPRGEHYAQFQETYWTFGNLIVSMMAVLHVFTLGVALGWPLDIARLVPVLVGLLFLALGNYLPRVRSNWFIGIRTPWTLDSEKVWHSTHRLAGRTFVVGGLICIAGAFLSEGLSPIVSMGGLLIGGFIPVIYSYVAWRREAGAR